MVNFREFYRVFSGYTLDLEEDSAIQVLDNNTGAHYRYAKDGSILLGGDPADISSIEELMNLLVQSADITPDGIDVYIG